MAALAIDRGEVMELVGALYAELATRKERVEQQLLELGALVRS